MPFNLAVMDTDAADKAYERIADTDNWYIGGHSLGGSMAASFAADSDIDFDGLILLASYSTADLSDVLPQ
jgi:alpha-beta hydrolase superfamily lysophospholipase